MLFGVSPSPFLLGATLRYHLDKQKDDWVADDLKNSCTWTMSSQGLVMMRTRSTITVIHVNSWLAQECVRQWTTNSSKLKENLVAKNTIATDKPKVLGLEWDSNADTISLPLMKVVLETKAAKALHDQLTKRSVLSIFFIYIFIYSVITLTQYDNDTYVSYNTAQLLSLLTIRTLFS